jgi:hypothetical protein
MSSAHAEAASTTARLTLTGMVDDNCPVDVGGTTAYVAPGGTVTLEASLAGASVKVPVLNVLGIRIGTKVVNLDSRSVASFVDTVKINGRATSLHGPSDTIALHDVRSPINVEWEASAITLVPGVLGGITVPLNANNVSLPVGGELDWTGRIIPSADTRCGVAVALPTVKASVGTHTVTVPGVGVTVSLPGRSHSPTDAAPTSAPAPTGTSSAPPSPTGSSAAPPDGHTPSSGPGKHTGGHAPTRSAVDQPAWPGLGRHRMPAGRDTTKAALQRANAPASGPRASEHGAPTLAPIHADHRAPAADNQVAAPPGTQRLTGGSLPALLAIAAMLALSLVSAIYVRQHLLGDRG